MKIRKQLLIFQNGYIQYGTQLVKGIVPSPFLNLSPFEPTLIWENILYPPLPTVPPTYIHCHHPSPIHICHHCPTPIHICHPRPHPYLPSLPPLYSPFYWYLSLPIHIPYPTHIILSYIFPSTSSKISSLVRNHRLSPKSNPSCKTFLPPKISLFATNVCLCQCYTFLAS